MERKEKDCREHVTPNASIICTDGMARIRSECESALK